MTQPISTTPAASTAADRARRIAAIHAFADWLAQHPEVPAPDDMTAYAHGTAADVHELAATKGLEVRSARLMSSGTRWATIPIATINDHGMDIRYIRIGS